MPAVVARKDLEVLDFTRRHAEAKLCAAALKDFDVS